MQRNRRVAVVAVVLMLASTPSAVSWDCYGGWNPNETCSSQTSSCGSCGGCCEIVYECNIYHRRPPYIALTEFHACHGLCLVDWCY